MNQNVTTVSWPLQKYALSSMSVVERQMCYYKPCLTAMSSQPRRSLLAGSNHRCEKPVIYDSKKRSGVDGTLTLAFAVSLSEVYINC